MEQQLRPRSPSVTEPGDARPRQDLPTAGRRFSVCRAADRGEWAGFDNGSGYEV
jgi:hypothetical protein